MKYKYKSQGASVVAQWLGPCAFTAKARVRSLVREQRSHKPSGVQEKNKKTHKQRYKKLDHSTHFSVYTYQNITWYTLNMYFFKICIFNLSIISH